MESEFVTENEGVVTVSEKKNGDMVAMIRRDPVSKKHLVYGVKEMSSEDIARLIQPGFKLAEKK